MNQNIIKQKFYLILKNDNHLEQKWSKYGKYIIDYIMKEHSKIDFDKLDQNNQEQLVVQAINIIDSVININ